MILQINAEHPSPYRVQKVVKLLEEGSHRDPNGYLLCARLPTSKKERS